MANAARFLASTTRRAAIVGAVVLGAGGARAQPAAADGDFTLGPANARVTLIEYASVMCSHCAHFHHEVWARLKANYIDTGRVRFVLREIPSPSQAAALAIAGFQIARCEAATPEQYFAPVGALFDAQPAIFAAQTMQDVRARFVEIGAAAGLSEAQTIACINDPTGTERIRAGTTRAFEALGEFGTPTLVLNGTRLGGDALSYDGLSRLIDAALAG